MVAAVAESVVPPVVRAPAEAEQSAAVVVTAVVVVACRNLMVSM